MVPLPETYLDKLPVPAEGIYLTGSAALDDWQPGSSDLDILVVTPSDLTEADIAALEALHERFPDKPYLDAIYMPRSALGTRDGQFAHVIDGSWRGISFRPNPVLWATLDSHGVTLRGPSASSLGAAPDPGWLREWNLGNLSSYWLPWAAGIRTRLNDPVPAALLTWAAVWGALGPGRLHCTIATGKIISKTASADYTASLFPEHAGLLARAKASRLGDSTVTFDVQDVAAVCDLIDTAAESAARLKTR
jgi:hypothetical protein